VNEAIVKFRDILKCLEDLEERGRIILKWKLREIRLDDMEWFHLAQDRDQRKVLVNTVMNFRVPYNVTTFLSG
jgi:hypothetical protein